MAVDAYVIVYVVILIHTFCGAAGYSGPVITKLQSSVKQQVTVDL